MGKNQYVTKKGNVWRVVGEGNSKATAVVKTQKEAIDIARSIAKNQHSELIIQGKNGKFRDKDSYGKDPHPPKDQKH